MLPNIEVNQRQSLEQDVSINRPEVTQVLDQNEALIDESALSSHTPAVPSILCEDTSEIIAKTNSDTEISKLGEGPSTRIDSTTHERNVRFRKTPYPKETKPPKTAVPLRISSRSTKGKKPDRFVHAIFVFFVMACVTGTHGTFKRTEPLIWRPTSIPVVEEVSALRVDLTYVNPCQEFSSIISDTSRKSLFLEQCNREFEATFLKPLASFCTESAVHLRARREIITLVISAVVVIGFLAMSSPIYLAYKMKQLTNELESEIDSRLVSERELRRRISTLDGDLRKFEEKLITMESELFRVMVTNTAIRTKFVIYQMKIMNIADAWIRGKIHPDLFSLFNKTLPNHERYPYEEMTPIPCVHEAHSGSVIFKLQVKKVSRGAIVAAADPFFFRKTDSKNRKCKQNYRGPDLVLLNITSHEYCPLDRAVEQLTMRDYHYCFNGANSQGLAWWNELDCGNPAYDQVKHFFQIKTFGNSRFIYCPEQKIVMKNLSFNCPNYVFSLPIDIEFKIGEMEFHSITHFLRGNIDFSSREMHALNLRLFHHSANSQDPFDPVSWNDDQENAHLPIFLLFAIPVTIFAIFLFTFIYLRLKTKKIARAQEEIVEEKLIELKQQPTSQLSSVTNSNSEPKTRTQTTLIHA